MTRWERRAELPLAWPRQRAHSDWMHTAGGAQMRRNALALTGFIADRVQPAGSAAGSAAAAAGFTTTASAVTTPIRTAAGFTVTASAATTPSRTTATITPDLP